MPKVSVIMNCYNSDKYLKEAIDSVFAQTFTDWEIIFWDNASTDKSGDIAQGYDKKLKYFRGEKNVPLYHARNFAYEKCNGDYIAFLDCDDRWMPDKLEKQLAIFEKYPEVGFIYANSYLKFIDTDVVRLRLEGIDSGIQDFNDNLLDYIIDIETAIAKREVIDGVKSGGDVFNKALNFAGDFECFMRIIFCTKSYYMAEPLAENKIHSEAITSKTPEKNAAEVVTVLELLQKNLPGAAEAYNEGFDFAFKKASYSIAYSYLISKKKSLARKAIAPLMFSKLKYFLFYFVTFLPYGLIKKLS